MRIVPFPFSLRARPSRTHIASDGTQSAYVPLIFVVLNFFVAHFSPKFFSLCIIPKRGRRKCRKHLSEKRVKTISGQGALGICRNGT